MKVHTDIKEYKKQKNTVVTVGTFDGLHRGHLKILDTMKSIAGKINGTSVMVTFNPHPRKVISKDYNLKMLTTPEEKIALLNDAGIDHLLVVKFTEEFSQLTSDEFIKQIIVDTIGAAHMVVGHDHKFGRDRLGDENKLREVGRLYNFDVTSVPAERINDEIISSTKIRNSLFEGDIEKANLFLGRNYSMSGSVVKGSQRGRTLGFPTANIQPDSPDKAIAKRGVYAVACRCEGEQLFGIMNIGLRPTFGGTPVLVIEVHLLNFNRDIYGKKIYVEFMKRLRDEKKFETKEELIHQIEIDKQKAMQMFEAEMQNINSAGGSALRN